jgi:hypothetical protein
MVCFCVSAAAGFVAVVAVAAGFVAVVVVAAAAGLTVVSVVAAVEDAAKAEPDNASMPARARAQVIFMYWLR